MQSRRQLVRSVLGSGLLLGLSLALGCGGGNGGGESAGPRTYTLGAVLPLSGPAASVGLEALNSVQLAVEEFNASGVLGEGVTVELSSQDDASDPRQAVSAAHLMGGNNDVFGLVSHFNSGCFLPATTVYHEAGLMAISPAATNPEITIRADGEVYPEIARVTPHDIVQGKLAADHIQNNLNFTRISIVHDKTQYGQGLAEVVRQRAEANGLTVLSFSGLTVGERDFNALVATLKAEEPEAVYFGGLYDEAGLLVKQMREQGMTAHFVGADGAFGQDFFDAAGGAAEGATVSFPGTPLEHLEPAQEFLQRYEARYGNAVQNYGPYAFDTANILLEGLRLAIESGVTEPGPRLRQAVVEQVRGLSWDGALGSTSFDERGDTRNRSYSFYTAAAGEFTYQTTLNLED